jgi:DNA-binding IclR family transcriptional regulator
MPARHHRTVDRTVAILELAAGAQIGVSLAELASRLRAPKSSIQELTNGLLAAGYLVEHERRFLLGPGAFVLSLHTAGSPLRQVNHDELERAVGARIGDDEVFVDQAGEDVLIDFVCSKHPRRPILATATGKIILAHMPAAERNEFLRRTEHEQPEAVVSFLAELPAIRSTRLAFDHAPAVPGRYAVATPLIDSEDRFLAAICAIGGPELADSLPELGAKLRVAIEGWKFPRGRRRTAQERPFAERPRSPATTI